MFTNDELFLQTGGKAAEEHRVFCRDGTIENPSILSSSGKLGNDRTGSVETVFTKINQLEECQSKLHKDIATVKHWLIVSILVTVLAAVAIVYVMKTDIRGFVDEQSCHFHRG